MKPINSKLLKEFADRNHVLPILANVCIEWTEAKATDLEVYLTQKIESRDTSLTVDVKVLDEWTKHLTSYQYKQDWDKLHIMGEETTLEIQGIEATDYPVFSTIEWQQVELNTAMLIQAFQSVSFAITAKNFSPVLTWLYFYSKEWTIYAVGTDSFRLAEYSAWTTEVDFWVVIPVTSIKKILKVLKSGLSTTTITFCDNLVSFETWMYTVSSIVISGEYPKYQSKNIMPIDYERTLTIGTKELKESLDRIFAISKDINNYVEFKWNTLGVTHNWNVITELLESWETTWTIWMVALNGKYLYEFLKFSEEITIKFWKDTQPVRIDLDNLTYVIRPLVK